MIFFLKNKNDINLQKKKNINLNPIENFKLKIPFFNDFITLFINNSTKFSKF